MSVTSGNKKFFGVIMSKTSRKASLFVVKKARVAGGNKQKIQKIVDKQKVKVYNINIKGIRLKGERMKESVNIAFMLLNLALFGIIVGLNIKSMTESNKGEEGKANYYKHWSLQVSVLTIIVVAFTVAVKAVFNF